MPGEFIETPPRSQAFPDCYPEAGRAPNLSSDVGARNSGAQNAPLRLPSKEQFERLFIGLALAAALIKRSTALRRVYRVVRRHLRRSQPVQSHQPRRIASKPLRIKRTRARAIHSHVAHGGSRAPPGGGGSGSSDGPPPRLNNANLEPHSRQVLNGTLIRLTTFHIFYREKNSIRLGLYAAEQKRFGVKYITIYNIALSLLSSPIEIGQTLLITPGRIESETWKDHIVKTLYAAGVEIEPYAGGVSAKIDGLDSATCANLAKRFGPDFARLIVEEPSVLELFRYSAEKRAIIAAACEDEAGAAAKSKESHARALDALVWAGASKARARSALLSLPKNAFRTEERGGPYQLLFAGRQSFKIADRFAQKLDPESAERLRPQAILISALLALTKDGHTIATETEIEERAWLDFALAQPAARAALAALIDRRVVTTIERPLEDRRTQTPYVGLTTLIKAERRIEAHASAALAMPLTDAARTVIEHTITNAGTLLDRPGFALDAGQTVALRAMFENRLSIVTGPPGSGKTTVAALANIIAHELYPPCDEQRSPICGVALAGRAASMLRDAASVNTADLKLGLPASTIHRALGLDPEADEHDAPISKRKIETGVLIIDESSMINSLLLAHLLDETEAEHVVLLGDVDQLPPIGAGAPFADMIATGLAPVTRLEHNYRTDLAGIRALTKAINAKSNIRDFENNEGEPHRERPFEIRRFVDEGGVAYHEQTFGARGATAGELWRDLIGRGVNPHEIAVITPRNVGDEGTVELNRDIRAKLGFGESLAVGDILLIAKNRYGAPTPAGGRVDIFNGERCTVIQRGADFFAGLFPGSLSRPKRVVRFLHAGDKPADGTAYGYALTVHKAQGSQFEHVILVTARPDRFVSRASVYTAASRAREQLTIIGSDSELAACARRDEKPRRTLLAPPEELPVF
jgi:exodeoxyribonuclease V alpha subunit